MAFMTSECGTRIQNGEGWVEDNCTSLDFRLIGIVIGLHIANGFRLDLCYIAHPAKGQGHRGFQYLKFS